MGSPVTYSNEREIQLFPIGVHDESQVVRNGSHLLPQRRYKVILSPVTNQCMFEVTGGARFDRATAAEIPHLDPCVRVLVVRFSPSILILLSARFVSAQGGVKVFKREVSKTDFILYRQEPFLLPQSYKKFFEYCLYLSTNSTNSQIIILLCKLFVML